MILRKAAILETEGGGYVEEFSCKTKIVSGTDALDALAQLCSKRLFLVADPFFAQNGTAQQLADRVSAEACHIFSEVQPDPTTDCIEDALAIYKQEKCEAIVAVGGGSVIDCSNVLNKIFKFT